MKFFLKGLCLATMLVSMNHAEAMRYRWSELPPEEQRNEQVLEVTDPSSPTGSRKISFNQLQNFWRQCDEKYVKDGAIINASDLNRNQVENIAQIIADSVHGNDVSGKAVGITNFFCRLSTLENPSDDPLAKLLILCVRKGLILWGRTANWTGLFILGPGREASAIAEENYRNIMTGISE